MISRVELRLNAILSFVLSTALKGRLPMSDAEMATRSRRLAERFPHANFTGFEPNSTLRKLAESRFVEGKCNIHDGDLRNPTFSGSKNLIC